ncbi:hypothetical protein BB560_000009 [Smittium megazygosporum]|uniref:C3HC-type domain-containing protein n=1 Tax=Smittium megazygosporum TaxID=133381 RepID=A0A2T9ZLK1_9FUNG|nr:hypothetical protein BB560_000009 [Smittium megazygosporum]
MSHKKFHLAIHNALQKIDSNYQDFDNQFKKGSGDRQNITNITRWSDSDTLNIRLYAQYGWVMLDKETLKCSICFENFKPQAYTQLNPNFLPKALVSFHKKNCPWKSGIIATYQPYPASASTLLSKFTGYLSLLLESKVNIKPISSPISSDMYNSFMELVQLYFNEHNKSNSPPPMLGNNTNSQLCLAFMLFTFGWEPHIINNQLTLCCYMCSKHIQKRFFSLECSDSSASTQRRDSNQDKHTTINSKKEISFDYSNDANTTQTKLDMTAYNDLEDSFDKLVWMDLKFVSVK